MIKELSKIFFDILQWHQKRIEFLVLFIEALIKVRTVNLSELAEAFNTGLDKESNYRRIQRFFLEYNFSFRDIAKLLISFIPEEKLTICIDRTQWLNTNIFFLGVEYKGVSIPIIWENLEKKGSSNTEERKELLMEFINIFGVDRIGVLLADREFIGDDWFKWLDHMKIPFMIRIKDNLLLEKNNGEKSSAKNFFRCYVPKELNKEIFDIELKIIGRKISKDDYLIVATNLQEADLKIYAKRWSIETMFLCFKSKGFNLEDTKMTDPQKINKLIALISITFCWCFIVGNHYQKNKSKFRKDLNCYSKSIFKLGLETIRNALFNPLTKQKILYKCILLFSRQLLAFRKCVVE
jgi:hypothetical protein